MRRMRQLALTLVCLQVAITQAPAADKESAGGNFDRIQAVEAFLRAVYPKLEGQHGTLTIETREFNGPDDPMLWVQFRPCRTSSGVPLVSQKSKFNACPPPLTADGQAFLFASVWVGTKAAPIRAFGARGTFVTAKLEQFRAEVAKHPEWNQDAIRGALLKEKPRIGPNDAAELKLLPASNHILEFTGCKLDFSRASLSFEPFNEQKELQLTWEVSGKRVFNGSVETCTVSFDPFDGNLLRIY